MNNARFFFGSFVILLGLSILFGFPFFRILFALLFLWLGIKIISGPAARPAADTDKNTEDRYSRVMVFSEIRTALSGKSFEKASLVSVFSGGEVDLTAVKPAGADVTLEFVAVFSGLKVLVPDTWNIESEGMGILGAFENKAQGTRKHDCTAHVKGIAVLGSIEIVRSS